MRRNIISGWKELICYSCSNGYQTITIDNVDVEQKGKCFTSLGVMASAKKEQVVAFNRTDEYVEIGQGFTSFFSNQDDQMCPITSCKLLRKGCKEEMENDYIKMSEAEPYTIWAQ